MNQRDLDSRLLLVGGPPRSGTTLAMRLLENHPRVLGVSDDHVHESWALYDYGTRTGVVADLRAGVPARRVRSTLWAGLVRNDRLEGIADAPHTMGWPLSEPPPRPDGRVLPLDELRRRRACGLKDLPSEAWICLKSPEISHVLPRLAAVFPQARFLLVFRPLVEIAESMFRMGNRVSRVEVFHRRWRRDGDIPPGIPQQWHSWWNDGDDFTRCVLYGAAYLRAMAAGCALLPAELCCVSDHAVLRRRPRRALRRWARFLQIGEQGLLDSAGLVKRRPPRLPAGLERVSRRLIPRLHLQDALRYLKQRARND